MLIEHGNGYLFKINGSQGERLYLAIGTDVDDAKEAVPFRGDDNAKSTVEINQVDRKIECVYIGKGIAKLIKDCSDD